MAGDILLYERRGAAIWLTMNRPKRRNSLVTELVKALRAGLERACADDAARAIVIAGAGPVFCAGADVNQYLDAFDRDKVIAEGGALYGVLEAMALAPKPVIARVQRAAFGGAMGLVATADLAVAAEGTRFSLSEARLGLVPAVIGASMVRAIGPHEAKARMLLAEPFGPDEALRIGLVHAIAPEDQLDSVIDTWVGQIQLNAPTALSDTKQFIHDIAFGGLGADALRERSLSLAADRRAAAEGQEGLTAFLEKRRPSWSPDV